MIHASFIVVRCGRLLAATTRVDGRLGLPGGKVEIDEEPLAAALREAAEEGWFVFFPPSATWVRYVAEVEGRPVAWFFSPQAAASPLAAWKEAPRGISPITVPAAELAAAGFGNRDALRALGLVSAAAM